MNPESEPANHGRDALVRAVGVWGLTASIVNLTIAGSIFALPGTLAASLGASAALVFVLGAILFVPIALCFAAAGSRIRASGGPYVYVETAFGRLPGFLIAALLWISSVAGSGSIAAALSDQVSHAIPWMGRALPRALLLLGVYGTLVTVNARGVKSSAAANALFACVKVLPLILLVALGFRYAHTENFAITQLPPWRSLGTALILVVFAYSGVETALAPSGELRHTDKVVPPAVLAGVGIVVALYVAIQMLSQGVLGASLAGHPAPLAAIADRVVTGGAAIIALTAGVSLFGSLHGDLLGASRLLYALACDGLLPRQLAKVTRGRRVPIAAVIAHALFAWILATAGSFTTLALVSGGAFCFVYIGCAAAAWQLQRRGFSQTSAPLMLRGGPLIPALGVIAFMLILATLERQEWIAISGTIACLCGVYALSRWSRRTSAADTR